MVMSEMMKYVVLNSESRISSIEICDFILILLCLMGILAFNDCRHVVSLLVSIIMCLLAQMIMIATYEIVFVIDQLILVACLAYMAFQIRFDAESKMKKD